jgi:adenosylcobinamide-GDP ribazoletransferase
MTAELFGLLTRIRLSRRPMDLDQASAGQYLFPLVGMIVGLVAASVALVLNEFISKDMALISGGAVLVSLYFVTGILHTEGLADFADGMMASGSMEKKRQVMKDVHLGAGGVFATAMFLILFFAATSMLTGDAGRRIELWPFLTLRVPLAFGFVLAEVAGKLSMNMMMFMGPSSHEGMGSVFVRKASGTKLVAAIAISTAIAIIFVGRLFPLVFLGLIAGVAVTVLARKNFGGVSGDSFGAANEVGRLVTLIGWVLLA